MYGILDRAAAAGVTALPSNVARVQTDGFDVNRPEHILYLGTQHRDKYMRYVGAAAYYRCDPPPADVAWSTNPDGTRRDNPVFLHLPNDANGDGGQDVAPGAATPQNPRGGSWLRLEPVMGENDIYQYGGVQGNWDDYLTGDMANWLAINDYMKWRASEFYHPNSVLFIPSGWFAVAKPIVAKAGTLHLTGKREARDGAKSCLGFKDTDESFIIHYDETSGDTSLTQKYEPPNTGDRRSGAFTILKGFGIFNQAASTKDYRAHADMILLRARAYIENMWISGAPRHGINIVTSVSAATQSAHGIGNDFPGGNANSTRILFNSIQWCGGTGIRPLGENSNVACILGNEENYCGQSGVEESSFLGPNALISNHTTDCGIGVGSTYAHGYKHELGADRQTKPGCYVWVMGADGVKDVYLARAPVDYQDNAAQWKALIDTRPGTNDAVWAFYYHDVNAGLNTPSWFAKEWLPDQPPGTYVWAGARIFTGVNNRSGSVFCYDEGSQPDSQFRNSFGMHRCQLSGSGILNGAVGDIRNDDVELSHRVIRQDYYDEQTKKWEWVRVTIADVENGMVTPLKIESSKWGDGFVVKHTIEGKDLITRYNNNLEGRVAAIVGPNSDLAEDGSGRPFEAGTHLLGRAAIATTYPWKWLGHRIVFRELHEIPGENSMFEELGVGDWVLPARPNNPADPFDDNEAMSPGGKAGSVIVNAPQGRGAKQYIRFGKLDDTVSGSIPAPPPPPPPTATTAWGSTDHGPDITVSSDGLTATRQAGDGHRSGRGLPARHSGVRRFRVTPNLVQNVGVGLSTAQRVHDNNYLGSDAQSVSLYNDGWVQGGSIAGQSISAAHFNNGQTIDVQVDFGAGTVMWLVDGVSVYSAPHGLTGPLYPAYNLRGGSDAVTLVASPNLPAGVLAWDAPEA
jgi:hypothetical protein